MRDTTVIGLEVNLTPLPRAGTLSNWEGGCSGDAKFHFFPNFSLKRFFVFHANLLPSRVCEVGEGEGEGEVAFFSAKRWDRRNRADLIESATPCHDAQVVGPYRDSNPLRLTVLAAMSEDYTTAPQHLQAATLPLHNLEVLFLTYCSSDLDLQSETQSLNANYQEKTAFQSI